MKCFEKEQRVLLHRLIVLFSAGVLAGDCAAHGVEESSGTSDRIKPCLHLTSQFAII